MEWELGPSNWITATGDVRPVDSRHNAPKAVRAGKPSRTTSFRPPPRARVDDEDRGPTEWAMAMKFSISSVMAAPFHLTGSPFSASAPTKAVGPWAVPGVIRAVRSFRRAYYRASSPDRNAPGVSLHRCRPDRGSTGGCVQEMCTRERGTTDREHADCSRPARPCSGEVSWTVVPSRWLAWRPPPCPRAPSRDSPSSAASPARSGPRPPRRRPFAG
jgi:hypothetical protein